MRLSRIIIGVAGLVPVATGAQSAAPGPLDRYINCQYQDSLYPVTIIRRPDAGRGNGSRMVATSEGEKRVSVIDGYTIVLGQGAPSYFANMKVERSDPKHYASDKDAVTKSIEFAMDGWRHGEWEHMPFNGFDLYGVSDPTIDDNGPNGIFVLFNDSTQTIVTINFLGQPPAYRRFKTIDEHDAIRDRMLNAVTKCGVNTTPVTAGNNLPSLSNSKEFDDFMGSYYLHPRPDLVSEAIEAVEPSGVLKSIQAIGPLTAFFSEIFVTNPSRTGEWERLIARQPATARQILARAMAWARLGGVAVMDEQSPETNDLFWGAFFASGNPVYVKKLLQLVPLAAGRDDFMLWATGATAKWSLASNASQHPLVRSILEAEKQTVGKQMQDIISDLLTGDPERFKQEMTETYRKQKAAGKWK
jgi:hypothetical protein